MLSIALGIGFVFGLILINQTIAHGGRWIIFLVATWCLDLGDRYGNCVRGNQRFEAISRGNR
jgi:hypothetical protein